MDKRKMINTGSMSPIKILSITILCTILLLLGISFFSLTFSLEAAKEREDQLNTRLIYEEILLHRNKIELAFQLTLHSGADIWLKEYQESKYILEQAIQKGITAAPSPIQKDILFELSTASNRLRDIENRVLEIMKNKGIEAAREARKDHMLTLFSNLFDEELENFASPLSDSSIRLQLAGRLKQAFDTLRFTNAIYLYSRDNEWLNEYEKADDFFDTAYSSALERLPEEENILADLNDININIIALEKECQNKAGEKNFPQGLEIIKSEEYNNLQLTFAKQFKPLEDRVTEINAKRLTEERRAIFFSLAMLISVILVLLLLWLYVYKLLTNWRKKLDESQGKLEELNRNLESKVEEKTLEIKQKSITDPITGLPNRLKMLQDLTNPRVKEWKTIAIFDIDNFTEFKAAFGPELANNLLIELANRMIRELPSYCFFYKLDSDEFAITSSLRFSDQHFFKDLIRSINTPSFTISGINFQIKVCFGLAIDEMTDPIKKATAALLNAKKKGPGSIEIYSMDSDKAEEFKQNINWVRQVEKALDEDRLIPFFQGIRNNSTGSIMKYECLVRIIEKERIITPGYFLEPARKAGLLPWITMRMIDKALAYIQTTPYEISINVSAEDLLNENFISYLYKKINQYNIHPGRLIFEILESTGNTSIGGMDKAIHQLQIMGARIAIDDFGTDFSNFARLIDMKADFIKIDGSFVKNIHTNQNSYEIARAITNFSHNIGALVVAEYVHCQEVQNVIESLRVDFSQGYHFSKPRNRVD